MRIEKDIARQTIPVAIEGQTDKFALAIEHGRATVSTCNVVVGEETEVHLLRVFIGETAKIFRREQLAHDGFGLIVNVAFCTIHLLDDAFGRGVITQWLTTKRESLHLSIAKAHGEVGIRVMRHILFHTQFGCTEIAFLFLDGIVNCSHSFGQVVIDVHHFLSEAHARVLFKCLGVVEQLCTLLHNDGTSIKIVYETLVIASKTLVDGGVELRQIAISNMLAIVFKQHGQHLLIQCSIPFIAIVGKLVVLF